MQVISFMAIKGGVGKTTMAFQFAKYLQRQEKNIINGFRFTKKFNRYI